MPALKLALWDRLSPRRRRGVVWLTAAILGYTLIGFFLVPAIVKWQLVKQLPAITKRQAAVRQVRFNPYALSLSIRGLSLTEPDGRTFASWEEFYVNFQASSLFRWQWTFKDIRLVAPFGEVIMFRDGRLNFANMFAAEPNAPPPPPPDPGAKTPIPRIGIFQLVITNGAVAFEDQTLRNPFRTEYRPINLHLTGFTTRADADSPYSFEAEGDSGRRVAWSGNLTVEPLRSAGQLEIAGIDLTRFQPYLEAFTHAHLTNGVVDLGLAYRFEAGTNGTDLVVTNMILHGKEIALHDPANNEAVARLALFGVTNASLNLRARNVRLGLVKATEAALVARIGRNGKLNLLELLKEADGSTNTTSTPAPSPAAAPSPASAAAQGAPIEEPWTIEVDEFGIERAAVSFEDLSLASPFRTELKPIEVTLKHVSTRRDSEAGYAFTIASEASESIAGEGTFSLNPVRSGGALKAAGIELRKYVPYAENTFRGTIAAGKLDLAVPYQVALGAEGLQAGVSNLAVRVSGLEVKAPGGDETVVKVGSFALEDVGAGLASREARVGKVQSADGEVVVRRGKDGSLNLLSLVGSSTNAAPTTEGRKGSAPSAPAPQPGWTVAVGEVDIQGYTFKIEDLQPERAARFLVDQLALNVRGFSTEGSPPLATRLSLRLNEKGAVVVDGNLKLEPLSAEMGVGLDRIDLSALQPYLEQQARVNLVSGELGLTNQVRYEGGTHDSLKLSVLGNLWLTNLVTTDQAASKDLLRWDSVSLSGVDLALTPNRLKLDEVKVQGLKANLIINPDGTLNVSTLSPSGTTTPTESTAGTPATVPATPEPPASRPGEPFPIEVGALVLENVGLGFTDQSLQPAASLTIGALSGSIRGLSSAMNTTAEVDLAGKIDDQAPFGIKGRVNLLAAERLVDLEITNRSTQLTAFTPYTEKYLGHPLNKGRLTLGLKYQIQGQQLRAENRFEIDQLMLGPRNESPDATSLPAKLGVALLKDQNGRIELDVPIEGKLDDPEFRIGGAVMKVIGNLIIKAAASPFSLLGKLVGGGEELSFLEFTPGTTNLVEGELAKLDKLSQALTARPAVNLEIEGLADRERDRDALARVHLQERIRTRHWESLKPKARESVADASAPLDPAAYEGALRALFVETFGTNLTAILQTNALQAAAMRTNGTAGAAPERTAAAAEGRTRKKKGGLLGLGIFGGGSGTRRSAAEKGLSKSERAALDEMTPELMESLLAQQTAVSDDEMRQLMAARARWVQDHLLGTGAVTTERLFLVAPKPIPAGTRGETRVNLSLN